mmetsp:Transcript_11532/g.18758  ORF Transcript_11532/g.18758 Transcript_11532/m.18758 type:complete len:111 (-) Transcript_11532:12-344(-)
MRSKSVHSKLSTIRNIRKRHIRTPHTNIIKYLQSNKSARFGQRVQRSGHYMHERFEDVCNLYQQEMDSNIENKQSIRGPSRFKLSSCWASKLLGKQRTVSETTAHSAFPN